MRKDAYKIVVIEGEVMCWTALLPLQLPAQCSALPLWPGSFCKQFAEHSKLP